MLASRTRCASAHHWARDLKKLRREVRKTPAFHVEPDLQHEKTDAVDAEPICDAGARPTMRFVEVKTPDQQAALGLRRTHDPIVRQRTQAVNMIRGLVRGTHRRAQTVEARYRGDGQQDRAGWMGRSDASDRLPPRRRLRAAWRSKRKTTEMMARTVRQGSGRPADWLEHRVRKADRDLIPRNPSGPPAQ